MRLIQVLGKVIDLDNIAEITPIQIDSNKLSFIISPIIGPNIYFSELTDTIYREFYPEYDYKDKSLRPIMDEFGYNKFADARNKIIVQWGGLGMNSIPEINY